MMDESERSAVLERLAASEARVLALVEGLSAEQWAFREGPERWSIAEIVEHLVVFERYIVGQVCAALEEPADSDRRAAAAVFIARNEALVMGLAGARATKFQAREVVLPTGRWAEPDRLIAAFRESRRETMEFAEQTQAELRGFYFQHIAFGDLDCYQWLLLLGSHCERHALQIEEVMEDGRFPR
jgi:hypothetical protein